MIVLLPPVWAKKLLLASKIEGRDLMSERRVVVTGLGAITAIGNNVNELWNSVVAGKSGAGPITRFDTSKFKTKFACEIKNFNVLDHFDRKDARKYDLFTHYAVIAADEAIQQAGIDENSVDVERTGVIMSSGNGGLLTFENLVIDYVNGGYNPRFNPFFVTKVISNTSAGLISIKHGFQGVNYCPVAACASSNIAIIEAFNHIKWNKADVIVAGGSEAPITQATIGGFGAMRALSTENENPAGASRPFDESRNGFVAGEGGGALILEERQHAIVRGATIYAEIVGGGLTADAHHIAMSHSEGRGAYLSMKQAIVEAGITASEVDYINVHATSTPIGDIAESNALHNLYNGDYGNMCVSSSKSMTGHLMGGAGAVEAIITIKSILEGTVTPTINTKTIDPKIDQNLDVVMDQSRKKEIQYAISNTFGFGGHNASVLFKKA